MASTTTIVCEAMHQCLHIVFIQTWSCIKFIRRKIWKQALFSFGMQRFQQDYVQSWRKGLNFHQHLQHWPMRLLVFSPRRDKTWQRCFYQRLGMAKTFHFIKIWLFVNQKNKSSSILWHALFDHWWMKGKVSAWFFACSRSRDFTITKTWQQYKL